MAAKKTTRDQDFERYGISAEQWVEIRMIAGKLWQTGLFGNDELKCNVMAFVEWLANQNENFELRVESGSKLH